MALVGIAVAIPTTLLLRGDSERSGGWEWESGPAAGAPGTPPSGGSELTERRVDGRLGVSYRFPRPWQRERAEGVLRLRSPEGRALVAISAPAPAAEAEGVLDEALRATRRGYEDVRMERGTGRTIGGLPARGAVATAAGEGGQELRILIAVAAGSELSHLLQVFARSDASPSELADAQRILDALRYRR
jgi:hypothetical protein